MMVTRARGPLRPEFGATENTALSPSKGDTRAPQDVGGLVAEDTRSWTSQALMSQNSDSQCEALSGLLTAELDGDVNHRKRGCTPVIQPS